MAFPEKLFQILLEIVWTQMEIVFVGRCCVGKSGRCLIVRWKVRFNYWHRLPPWYIRGYSKISKLAFHFLSTFHCGAKLMISKSSREQVANFY